jgi:hypothetical protein
MKMVLQQLRRKFQVHSLFQVIVLVIDNKNWGTHSTEKLAACQCLQTGPEN